MLAALAHKYGMTAGTIASAIDVSDTAVRNWMGGFRPSIENAVAVSGLFSLEDGTALLREWGFNTTADSWQEVAANTTHDPNVANGWRLDTLIAEIRELRKELRQRPTLIETTTVQRGEVLVLRAGPGSDLVFMESLIHELDLDGKVILVDDSMEIALIDKEESNE